MERLRGEVARAKWRAIVAEQEASGDMVAGYCRKRKMCAPRFFSWKKRLAQAAAPPGLVEIQLSPGGAGAGIVVALRGGRRVEVERGFDAETLRQVVRALEAEA